MKKFDLTKVCLLLVLPALLASCVEHLSSWKHVSSSPVITETRQLKGFEKIEVTGSPTVYYTQADSFSVKVVGPEDYVENILTEVNGQTLKVRNKGKIGILNIHVDYDDEEAGVYVTSPDLTSVQLNGSGDFKSDRRVDSDRLQITLRGSGDIDFKDVICDRCTTELVGSGDIDIDRLEALTSDVTLVGSGDISIKQWSVKDTDLSLRGSGDIKIRFSEGCQSAKAVLTGSGDIQLKGRLTHYNGQKRGSGDIDISQLSVEK